MENREILFRGKDKSGVWHEGFLTYAQQQDQYYIGVTELLHPVISESVGQFIGLLDKNGKRIFDGYLIKHNKNRYVVKWVDSLFRYRLVSVNHDVTLHARELDWLKNVSKYSEIIGNIHDNPELLNK